jgi:hypothetical protein
MELVYISHQTHFLPSNIRCDLRFIYGQTYKAISFTGLTTTFLDKNGDTMEFSNITLQHWFGQKDKFRDEQINKILEN